ncbi:AbrB/MazE/SpoVT family DNA-binding domain-containing protein [Zooshikella marina]|uniref:AbrB/MazE/SpoVT family DNA-binding domain-containing protein n=1 Tax=Zooshikella ganghwensis TaxID=202772 RepID=A0A4P9VFK1_9GAMM|nr:AbrB/MazE/SpoVT family DNA-binding domain-containing protein [Zooshikella ganghwensis]MBU2709038.1 AbrB/MazE/SpoVT family DNA-binding domain-containing protein [Zooshikella ganghwensis]RDH41793.1 AbrB/MazE/SpoVT family DNA-binding domain-containing protein [Zooshikella ganghwensis]
MKVTTKGQVTIPQAIRDKKNITADTEVEFIEAPDGRIYIEVVTPTIKKSRFRTAHKVASVTMTTDEIMALTRGDN